MQDFGKGMAVQSRLKKELGFTYRYHRGLVPNDFHSPGRPLGVSTYHYEDQVHLDFFNEQAQTWFQLRYLNII